MPPKTMHGARAKVFLIDANGAHLVGIWNNFSYNVSIDVQPSYILGRYSAAELTTTGVEPVSITAQGWRVIDFGPMKVGGITSVKDLLLQEYILLQVYDRQTKKVVANIKGCLPTGFSSTVSAKQLQENTNTYLGLLMDDESVIMSEAVDAADLP